MLRTRDDVYQPGLPAKFGEHYRAFVRFASAHAGESVLDLGCGYGAYSLALMAQGPQKRRCVGCDINVEYLKRALGGGLPVVAAQNGLPFPDKAFDTVLLLEVIEHVPQIEALLKEAFRVARKNVLVTVPNVEDLELLMGNDVTYGHMLSSDHVHFFDSEGLSELLRGFGADVHVERGDPIYPFWFLSRSLSYYALRVLYRAVFCGRASLVVFMQLQAFAKINLDLRVLGRRDDGYHEVRTVLQTIDWADEIRMDPADRFEFVEQGMRAGEENLVVKATRAFEQLTGRVVHARMELVKHVPAGAGLGGGSADAAITILGLQKLFGEQIQEADLIRVLSGLGSDVPFFAFGGRAQGTGRGNDIALMEDDADYGLVVIVPSVAIATRDAYSWLTLSDKSNNITRFCAQPALYPEAEPGNDFESVVFPRHPILSEIKTEILRAGALRASLSGTGSALFGIFGSSEEAEAALPHLSSWGTARVTRPLSRPEYLRRIWGVAKW